MNEILLVASLFVIYGCVLLAYRMFGKSGLYCFTAIATITANIEVLIMVKAFGMEQTLGNILFASTFLVTDIISEIEGKKRPRKRSTSGYSPRCFHHRFPVLAVVSSGGKRLGAAGYPGDLFQYAAADAGERSGVRHLPAV